MAEINIQRRQRSVWPWVLAAVLLLGLVWVLFARNTAGVTASASGDSTFRDTTGAAAGTLAPPPNSPPR